MIERALGDEASTPASEERRDLGRVLRKYCQVIVFPVGVVTVFANGVITKTAEIGLGVVDPLEKPLLFEAVGIVAVLFGNRERQKVCLIWAE